MYCMLFSIFFCPCMKSTVPIEEEAFPKYFRLFFAGGTFLLPSREGSHTCVSKWLSGAAAAAAAAAALNGGP